MFAEEIGANASRKRQQEARARQRRLKQEQQRKQQQKAKEEAAAAGAAAAAAAAAAAPPPPPTTTTTTVQSPPTVDAPTKTDTAAGAAAITASAVIDTTTPTSSIIKNVEPTPVVAATATSLFLSSSSSNNNNNNTAVANALQQRELRQQAQTFKKAAVKIQSFYRAHLSNKNLLQTQSKLLSKRLLDLDTLRKFVIQQQNQQQYVPPPATTTALLLQYFFLSKRIPYITKNSNHIKYKLRPNNAQQLQSLLICCLIPSVTSTTDSNMNIAHVWIQNNQHRRLQAILQLCLLLATDNTNNNNQKDVSLLKSIVSFIQPLLASAKTNQTVRSYCQALLFPTTTISTSTSTKDNGTTAPLFLFHEMYYMPNANLDLLSMLRNQLLYSTGGSDPIPKMADKLRQQCIPPQDRQYADVMFQFVLHFANNKYNKLRLVSDILTVPLLTWKVSAASYSKLLHITTNNKILLLEVLESFTNVHGDIMSLGKIEQVLGQQTLTNCPSTPSQCLLANLIQIGSTLPSLNGSDTKLFDYQAATLFYSFIATLVDAVPLGTFSSSTEKSVVEWVSDDKGQYYSPIVLSTVIMDQCKALLVDAYVRQLFQIAIVDDAILQKKNEKDIKHEQDLAESISLSAASLAAKEARIDRNKSLMSLWTSNSWAKKISKATKKIFEETKDTKKSETRLMNTSLVSRNLAAGSVAGGNTSGTDSTTKSDTTSLSSLSQPSLKSSNQSVHHTNQYFITICRVYAIILARWGGGGREDIVSMTSLSPSAATTTTAATSINKDSSSTKMKKHYATARPDPCTMTLLNVLCFSTPLVRTSWAMIQSSNNKPIIQNVYEVIDATKGKTSIKSRAIRPCYAAAAAAATTNSNNKHEPNDGAVLLYMFIRTLSHVLIITDDVELHEMERPIPLFQLRRCVQTLKQLLYRACCVDTRKADSSGDYQNDTKRPLSNYFGLALIHASSRTMRDLYDRSSRRPFCVPKLWLVEDLMEREIRACKTHADYVELLSNPVLRVCPFLVSFKRRLKIFERIVTTSRVEIQGENSQNPFHTNPLKPGIPVRIMRGRILEDGLATMNNLGRNMRQRIAVQYVNEAGTRESGVDAGGLFKEFWTDLSSMAFNLNYALFRVTEGAGNCLYPNPSSAAAHGSDHIVLFEFLGRILGKALYEGITIHPQFAHFFLSFLRGDYNFLHMLPDLGTIDPQLYGNLMFLKNYDGDAEDLCLTFTVACDDFGGTKEIPLLPNGADMPVTNANKQRYIGLVAKYYVIDRVKEQSEAFTRGLWEVIDRSWLRIFNEPELQVLISGATDGKIDVADMRANTRYTGGYTGLDRTINRFWNVVASLNSKQQADLLRFVTSCARPPPLGFSSMNPPFTIQRVGILRDGDKLPSSSTCFNTLKLPTYSSEKVLKQRLLYAIEAGVGFELT